MTDDVRDPLPPVLSQSTLNLLAGASGVGKTALIAYMARCFLRGETLFGYRPHPVPAVGYIGADRKWTGDTELWFQAYGLADEIRHYALVEDPTFDTARLMRMPMNKPKIHAEIFEEHVDRLNLPRGSLLFVDPIALYVGGDMNNYVRCAMGCINLQRVIIRRALCTIGIDHSSKQKGGDDARYTRLQDRIGGSMAKLGYTSTQMYLAGPEEMDADHHTFLWNPHHARSQTFTLQQDPKTGLFTVVGDDRPAAAQPVLQLTDACRALYATLPDPPTIISTAQIVQQFTDVMNRATVFRYLRQLETQGLLHKSKHGAWTKIIPGGTALESDGESEE